MIHHLLLALAGPAHAGAVTAATRPEGLDAAWAPRRVALVIGVDTYRDPALTPLSFAAKDASDLGAVLADPSFGGFDQVLVLQGDASRAAIEDALSTATADLQRDDTFLLYLSGHGTLTLDAVEGTSLWFLPSDARLDDAARTGIPINWLEERVSEVEARRRVLIMDTCHNGRDKSSIDPSTQRQLTQLRGEPPAPRAFREVSESEARLFAAQFHQPAMEDPELGNGVYTHYLIKALTRAAAQADLDGDGLVDVTEAHDWARDRTIVHTGGMQVPRAEYRIVGREEVYLSGALATRTAAERALLTATDAILARARVLVDGVPRGVVPDVVDVEPGFRRIEVEAEGGRSLVNRLVRVRAGETVMLEDLVYGRTDGLQVSVGGVARQGPGADLLHPVSPELQVAWLDPVLATDSLTTDLHLRFSAVTGHLPDEADEDAWSGQADLGVYAGLRPWRGPVALGPTGALSLPWRSFHDLDGLHRQSAFTGSVGGRVDLRLPLGVRSNLLLRYDARWTPFRHDVVIADGELPTWSIADTWVVTHGVSIGTSWHPRR